MNVYVFPSAEEFFEFVLGPSQHDAHVKAFVQERWLRRQKAFYEAADERVAAFVAADRIRQRSLRQ